MLLLFSLIKTKRVCHFNYDYISKGHPSDRFCLHLVSSCQRNLSRQPLQNRYNRPLHTHDPVEVHSFCLLQI